MSQTAKQDTNINAMKIMFLCVCVCETFKLKVKIKSQERMLPMVQSVSQKAWILYNI